MRLYQGYLILMPQQSIQNNMLKPQTIPFCRFYDSTVIFVLMTKKNNKGCIGWLRNIKLHSLTL